MEPDRQVEIGTSADIVTARQDGRQLAFSLGFRSVEVTMIATAISEIARNIVDHAKRGQIAMTIVTDGARRGLRIIARDQGPGIPDIALAMQYGYSTRKGLGVGLPGSKSLMDEFDVVSEVGRGTTVTMVKWRD